MRGLRADLRVNQVPLRHNHAQIAKAVRQILMQLETRRQKLASAIIGLLSVMEPAG